MSRCVWSNKNHSCLSAAVFVPISLAQRTAVNWLRRRGDFFDLDIGLHCVTPPVQSIAWIDLLLRLDIDDEQCVREWVWHLLVLRSSIDRPDNIGSDLGLRLGWAINRAELFVRLQVGQNQWCSASPFHDYTQSVVCSRLRYMQLVQIWFTYWYEY